MSALVYDLAYQNLIRLLEFVCNKKSKIFNCFKFGVMMKRYTYVTVFVKIVVDSCVLDFKT